jgi:predicted metal-dependent enzyme (double-stranded beta helix superfamily)
MMSGRYTVEQFAQDLSNILKTQAGTKEAVFAAGPLLQRLAREGWDFAALGTPRASNSGLPSRLLVRDPEGRFTLAFVQFPPGGITPVHSHESWGAMCLLTGSERYTSWRLADDRAEASDGLAVVLDHHMEPGDLGYWFSDPYNIHRQWPGDRGCTELVLFGGAGARVREFPLATERG